MYRKYCASSLMNATLISCAVFATVADAAAIVEIHANARKAGMSEVATVAQRISVSGAPLADEGAQTEIDSIEIAAVYVAFFKRAPDYDGLNYWDQQTGATGTVDLDLMRRLTNGFAQHPSYVSTYGSLSDEAFIDAIYINIGGAPADADGRAYWLAQLTGGLSRPDFIAQFILDLLSFSEATLDHLVDIGTITPEERDNALLRKNRLTNKATVALAFSNQLGTATNLAPGTDPMDPVSLAADPAYQASQRIIAGVTEDSATRDAALAYLNTHPSIADINAMHGNQPPHAESVSKTADEGIVYVEAQLIGSDPDGDQIHYNLISPRSGTGYVEAYVGANSGRLYVTLDGSETTAELQYNVSDGIAYSNTATASFRVVTASEKKGTGAEEVDAQTYGNFNVVSPWGDLLGAPGAGPSVPTSVDLTPSFPLPGDQGQQGSCVGWATAYAIKSYFEKRDLGWDLSQREHVFSPAFIFNAIERNDCTGSLPNEALDRLKDIGAVTWDKMPYSDQECTVQPTADANAQAASYRIQSWGTLRTVDDMKAQIANHRPVLLTLNVYPAFRQLSGTDSVYNDFSGSFQGGHAIAIVGYDDNRFGGAFKVINSWGTSWGDQGFFWFPYSAVSNSNVFKGAYSIEDIPNTAPPVDPVDPPPVPPSNASPNLEILSWQASYDPRPNGQGSLQFDIANSGSAIAPSGAYVNLMLSRDMRIGSDDVFVIYEPIPFDLNPGEAAYRDSSNALTFYFPDTLQAGTYQMALWVDDLDSVAESNEDDNVSFGDPVQIENVLPDLVIQNWYAEWSYGAGSLTYEVMNQGVGTAKGGWDVNLMLSADDRLGNSDDLYLAYETVPFDLAQYGTVSRNRSTPMYFNVDQVPPGTYLMALWIDDLNQVTESNERNNESWGGSPVSFGYGTDRSSASTSRQAHTPAQGGSTGAQYNGRRLPDNATVLKVRISDTSNGGRTLQVLGNSTGPKQGVGTPIPGKANQARNRRGFPVNKAVPMPGKQE